MKTKNLFLMLFIFVTALSLQSFSKRVIKKNNAVPAMSTVRYLGENGNYFLFEIALYNNEGIGGQAFKISIRANNQDEIFNHFYPQEELPKIFKIVKTDIEMLSFGIYGKKNVEYFDFEVKTTYNEAINVVTVR